MDEYYNSNNLDTVFNVVDDIVFQNTNVKIKDHKKARQQFQKMAHIVAKKFLTDSITLPELNEKLNTNAVDFFTKLVKTKKEVRSSSSVDPVHVDVAYMGKPADYMPPNASNVPTSKNVMDSNMDTNSTIPANYETYNIDSNLPEVIGNDLPLFNNLDEIKIGENENIDLDSRVNDYLNSRNNIMESIDEPPSQRQMYETPLNQSVEAYGVNNNKNGELVHKENVVRGSIPSSTVESYKNLDAKIDAKFARITERIENALINPKLDEKLFKALFRAQNDAQPSYINRSNYIIVNSGDRDWLNTSLDDYNRYNFNIKFGNHENGASIKNVYKNITSIELVNAFMPKDNVLIGFDTRPYIDILTYPYLVLKIPELTNVFRGTNDSSDNAFSVLVYDKKHDSQVLSNDFITGSNSMVNSIPERQFYSEYNKSYYKYIPAYFEKKVYDNQPLASLTHMNINIVNPNNENINVMRDVLEIDSIAYTGAISGLTEANFEYDLTHSYPNDGSAVSRQYLQITTDSVFSSKLFRIGDNIKISGLTAAGGANADEITLVNYLNRDAGHYILNFDKSNLAAGENQGFTSNIYIAPPGDIQINSDGTLDASTYIGSSDANTANITIGSSRLINTHLQTHFLFKINTREADFAKVHNAMNV